MDALIANIFVEAIAVSEGMPQVTAKAISVFAIHDNSTTKKD